MARRKSLGKKKQMRTMQKNKINMTTRKRRARGVESRNPFELTSFITGFHQERFDKAKRELEERIAARMAREERIKQLREQQLKMRF
jgi:hypothetical protein